MDRDTIVTGVDKLMKYVIMKKSISMDDAAQYVGVSRALISEWADFLEQEGMVTVEHKLTRSYLTFKKTPVTDSSDHRQLMKKTKAATNSYIDKKIEKVKAQVRKRLDGLQNELKELEATEHVKEERFKKGMHEIQKKLKKEMDMFQSFQKELSIEKNDIKTEKIAIKDLKTEEGLIEMKIEKIEHLLGQKASIPSTAIEVKKENHREEIRKLNSLKAELLAVKNDLNPASFDKKISSIDSMIEEHRKHINNIAKRIG